MPVFEQVQLNFEGGANAQGAEHAVEENQVVTATNVDFSLHDRGLSVRRGSNKLWSAGGVVYQIARRYSSPIGNSPFYILADSTVKRLVGNTFTPISSGATAKRFGFTSYRGHAYVAVDSGPGSKKDTGSSVVDWVKLSPTAAPQITVQTLTPLTVVATYTVVEGTSTASTWAGGTCTATSSSNGRLQILASVSAANLNSNGGGTIGDFGIDYLTIEFDKPSLVKKVSRDFSIGDASFNNYFHTEMDVMLSDEALPDPEDLVDSLLTTGTGSDGVDEATRAAMTAWVKTSIRGPVSRIAAAKDSPNIWAVARTDFEFIGSGDILDGWANIGAARVVVETYGVVKVKLSSWQVRGAETYPLNDPDVGIVWWETFANVDGEGNVIDETAPSAPSARARVQHARAVVVSANTTSDTELNKRIFYRQGGYLRSPYPVGTLGIGTATFTDTLDDIKVLSTRRDMPIDLLRQVEFPNNIVAASEPFHDRIFVGYNNKLRWCKPGNPTAWPRLSETTVSHSGDTIQSILVWGRIVIVNRDSVYEMDGGIFEGDGQDWTLQRSGSRRGSFAPNSIIRTPYGILLLDWDGLYMYMPGQGVDIELTWAMERMADAFRGAGSSDPSSLKGDRIPPINLSFLQNSSATWADEKLYLACPVSSEEYPSCVFVLDFRSKRIQWYTYPFNITSLFWDREGNRLLAGTSGGSIMQLETGVGDKNDSGTTIATPWTVRTRLWTAPTDSVLENVKLNFSSQGVKVKAILDVLNTSTLGTFTSSSREWAILPLSGSAVRSLQFEFSGSKDAAIDQGVFGISWDAMVEPPRVQYSKSEYFDNGYPGEKLWDVLYIDIHILGTGTATSTAFIDGVAVSTSTMEGPTLGKVTFPFSLSPNTFGGIAHTITTCDTTNFKLWPVRWGARNEPPRLNSWTSDRTHKENEHEWRTFEAVLDPNGTCEGEVFLDGTSLGTYTFSGTGQQSYVHALPLYSFGRTIWAQYSGSAMKVYLTWFEGTPEPDRVLRWRTGPIAMPSNQNLKTWVPTLDVLGGDVVGVLVADGTAISTQTFSYNGQNWKQTYPRSIDMTNYVINTASTIEAIYQSGSVFKHYDTNFEMEAHPFGKTQWTLSYKKLGGASQLDMPVFFGLDIESPSTATVTLGWDVDGAVFQVNTLTFSGREFRDRIPLMSGARGRLFQLRLQSDTPIEVYRAWLDMIREGIKDLSRGGGGGTPSQEIKFA